MKKAIACTVIVLAIVLSVAQSPANGRSRVSFDRQEPWIVMVDGAVTGIHTDRSAARQAAARHKRDAPDSFVGFGQQTMWVAQLDELVPTPGPTVGPPSTPPPATPGPTVGPPSTPPPATPLPTVGPPSTPPPATPAPTPTPTTPTPTPTPPVAAPLVWGYDTTAPQPDWIKPELYQTYRDPAYGTAVTRVTSADGTRFNRTTYSRRQAENADGTRFMTYHGTAAYHVYDRSSGALVQTLSIHPDAEPQWHPTNPHLIRHLEGPNSYVGDLLLFESDLRTGESLPIADLSDRIRQVLPDADYMKDRAEGSPSSDGNRYAWLVYDTAEQIIGVATYDLRTDRVLGLAEIAELPDAGRLDAISMSPTGQYVVAQYGDGTYVFDADLTNERLIFEGGEHSDIALGANGQDVYVYIDFTASGTGGWLIAVDLATLTPMQIFDLYDDANTSIHISGKGYNKPGWVVASTYNCHAGFAWSCHKVMAVELAPNGRVLNLAHTYNCGQSYWTETHAVVNRDFNRIYFNSDGGSCGIDAEVMLVDVPDFE